MARFWTFDDSGPRCEALHRENYEKGINSCRECGAVVTPPRRSWCSKECVDTYQDRARSCRAIVQDRDQGLCAGCGTQTNVNASPHEWEADHIVPLVEGGAHLLSNMRTLCIACHKTETAALRARLKAKKEATA